MSAPRPSHQPRVPTPRVLVIEQDERTGKLVRGGLTAYGFTAIEAGDGASGISALRGQRIDLVVLDLHLRDVDGLQFLASIRTARPRLPVIAVSARDDEHSKLDAFARGADDHLTKPFSNAELAARIKARLRWCEQGGTRIEAGPLSFDLASSRAQVGDHFVQLSLREGSLLATFLRHAGEVLTREDLLRLVWGLEFDPHSNLVDVYVATLRRKLGPKIIETVRGRGYRYRIGPLIDVVGAQ